MFDDVNVQDGIHPQRIFEGVFAGKTTSAAIAANGELFVWGDVCMGIYPGLLWDTGNVQGSLLSDDDQLYVEWYTPPVCFSLANFGNSPVRTVSLGDCHVLVVTEAGCLFTSGFKGDGRLGRGYMGEHVVGTSPLTHVAVADAHVTDVAAGINSSCFVTKDGWLFTFGANSEGECALGDVHTRWSPEPVPGFGAGEAKAARASMHMHIAVLDVNCLLYTAGENSFGELGTGDCEPRLLLSHVESCAMYMVVCGLMHTLALDLISCVWVCGSNHSDTVGVDSVCVLQPVEGLSDVVFVTAGVRICMAVDSVGTAFEWGSPRSRASEELWWPGSTDARVIHTYVPEPRAVAVPARVGRYNLRLGPLFALALAMGGHKRLGEKSWLYMPSTDVLRQIADAYVVRDPAN